MKTLMILLMTLSGMLMYSCSEDYTDSPPSPASADETISMPFKAVFTSTKNSLKAKNIDACGSEYILINEEASGSGTCLGKATMASSFCTNLYEIKEGYTYLTASDGDVLYLAYHGCTCYGSEDSGQDWHGETEICCWQVPFTILGGSGRFENATGSGVTDDFLSYDGNIFHHTWKGTITLKSGNQDPRNY